MSAGTAPKSQHAGPKWTTAVTGLAVGAMLGGVVVGLGFAAGFWLRAEYGKPKDAVAQGPSAPAAVAAPKPPAPKPAPVAKPAPRPADPDAGATAMTDEMPKAAAPKPAVPDAPKPDPEPKKPAAPPATYAAVAAIFQGKCNSCHNVSVKKGGLDLSTYAALMKGGNGGREVVPGMVEKSYLWDQLENDSMPPDGKEKLTPEEKMVVRAWIAAGAMQ